MQLWKQFSSCIHPAVEHWQLQKYFPWFFVSRQPEHVPSISVPSLSSWFSCNIYSETYSRNGQGQLLKWSIISSEIHKNSSKHPSAHSTFKNIKINPFQFLPFTHSTFIPNGIHASIFADGIQTMGIEQPSHRPIKIKISSTSRISRTKNTGIPDNHDFRQQ